MADKNAVEGYNLFRQIVEIQNVWKPYKKNDAKLSLVSGQWPNLKNLSGGLNLSRGLNMVGST